MRNAYLADANLLRGKLKISLDGVRDDNPFSIGDFAAEKIKREAGFRTFIEFVLIMTRSETLANGIV